MSGTTILVNFIGAFVLALIMGFLTAFIGQLCWNHALIDIFPNLPEISYWKMYGIILLTQILFSRISAK